MSPRELMRVLEKGLPGPAYFFHGQEIYLKNKAMEKISQVVPEGVKDFGYDLFYGGEAELEAVLTAARTLPFGSPRRVVVLRDLEKMKLNAEQTASLEAYLNHPSPETTLVITSEDTNAGRSWAKKFPGLWKEVDFRPLTVRELQKAVQEAAAGKGCRISAEAVDVLLEAVGRDLSRIHQELEKLSTALGEGGAIGAEEVRVHVAGYSHQKSFELVQAMSARNLPAALKILSRLLTADKESPLLIGMIGKRLRILWFLAAGEKVPSAFRVQSWQLKELQAQAAGFSRPELESALKSLLETDTMLKSTALPPRLLLERFLLNFLQKGDGSIVLKPQERYTFRKEKSP